MTTEQLLQIIDTWMRAKPKYEKGKRDCEWWVRYLFRCDGVEFSKNVYEAESEFVLVIGKPQIMDVTVFRNDDNSRHVGVMIDARTFTHFSEQLGISKDEISRPMYRNLNHYGRHKNYVHSVRE